MKTKISMALTFAVLSVMGMQAAHACKCAAKEKELWEAAQPIVFLARIVATEITDQKAYEVPVVAAKFQEIERFRGNPERLKVLRTTSGGNFGSCGIPFTAGDQFLVFATDDGWATQCAGTKLFQPGKDEKLLEKLRQSKAKK